ncbi:proline--tRNA ligase [Candidatus Woesearchaeota archaeon]|nr:proline--tRNA ligase [Candidatus Woesearchaeota archaeon]
MADGKNDKGKSQRDGDKKTTGVTVKKSEDFSEWYTQVVQKADLADYTSVSGCMVFKPYSYAIWEKVRQLLDARLKQLGVKNAYFPLFIPESLFKKEAEHVEGFTPEVAWVTQAGDTKLDERLAVRPTSETIIYESYSKWIRSWRDLPLLINQWCNVVRWEFKYPKPFIRTREFLWQEGHTVHETEKQAGDMVLAILGIYREIVEQALAIHVIPGRKSEQEKFAGAVYTTTIEALMPDGKALQMGTSHNLGQNFGKAFGISFLGKGGKRETPWQTSWGMSTRVIGALIMAHGDDHGLVLPPNIAPIQAVIVPILFEDSKKEVLAAAAKLKKELEKENIIVELDDRETYTAGWKFNVWELKGVPLRIELGPRDLQQKQAVLFRRDTAAKETVKLESVAAAAGKTLAEIQQSLYQKSKQQLEINIVTVKSVADITAAVKGKKLARGFFCGSAKCEEEIKAKADGAASRCMSMAPLEKGPIQKRDEQGKCAACGKEGITTWFGKAY